MTNKEKEISLSELLSTDFIIVDNKMVGTFPLDRINMISDVLKQQKEEIKRLNNIVNKFEQWVKDGKKETLMGLGTINKIFFADELLDKLKELKGE